MYCFHFSSLGLSLKHNAILYDKYKEFKKLVFLWENVMWDAAQGDKLFMRTECVAVLDVFSIV